MTEELYEQHASLSDQKGEHFVESIICAIRDTVDDLSPEYKRHLRSFVSSGRPRARQQQATRAQKEIEAARDSAAHLIAFALSSGCRALVVPVKEEDQEENSNDQDSVPDDGSSIEESEHIAHSDVNTVDSNEDDNDHSSGQEVLNEQENSSEASSEQDQAGPSLVSNTASTLTRRSVRASARNVNYAGAMENYVIDLQQQATLTGTRKRKRSNGRSGKSTANKRTRGAPSPTVAPEETDESEDEDYLEPEIASEDEDYAPVSEAISLSIIVRRLNCRVPGCNKVFPSKAQLDDHLLVKHAIEKYACKVKDCTESYATRTELTTHSNSAHDDLDNDWPCGQCEVTCNNYHNLGSHTYQYHEYGLFACSADKCDYTEKTRIKVKNHQAKHRPAKHRCTYADCSSSFYRKSALTIHLRVHSKEKPFLCSQCPKAFAHKNILTIHERVHSGFKPYSCTWPQCDYSAIQQSSVIVHIRGVHFGLPLTMKEQRELRIIDNRDPRLFVKKTFPNGN